MLGFHCRKLRLREELERVEKGENNLMRIELHFLCVGGERVNYPLRVGPRFFSEGTADASRSTTARCKQLRSTRVYFVKELVHRLRSKRPQEQNAVPPGRGRHGEASSKAGKVHEML